MKRIVLLLSLMFLYGNISFAQNANVISALKAKYSLAQYHAECGGWYFISYQKDGQTYYGFTDRNGNVIASDASKYKLHKGYIELYLLDADKKAEHDQWILDMKQYNQDYQNYKKVKTEYENEIKAYNAKVEAAKKEATNRWNHAKQVAIEKARRENQAKQQQQQNSSNNSILGAILTGVAQGLSEVTAANSVQYEPYLNQVLGERNLSVAPAEPYNPMPTQPREPETGYYWKSFSLLQPCPYDHIEFESIENPGNFANVKKDGKYGLVDSYMNEIVACTNSQPVLQGKLGEELFVVKKSGKTGVINSKAKVIIPFEYSSITSEGNKIKVCQNQKYGLFDYDGREIMPCIFETMKSSNGYLLCERDNLWGVYTTDFEELYPCQFQKINFSNMNNKLILNTQTSGLWGVIDFETGQSLLPNNYTSISSFKLGNEYSYLVSKDDVKGLYSHTGILLLPCEYSDITLEGNNVKVKKNNTVGIYDLQGMPILSEGHYTDYSYENWYLSVKKDGKFGVCTPYGIELIPCKYDKLEWNKELLVFLAKDGNKCTLLTPNGVELFQPVEAYNLYPQANDFIVRSNTEYMYDAIDYNGNVITKANKRLNFDKIEKQVEKYRKNNDITTISHNKRELIADANNKVNQVLAAEFDEKGAFSYFAQNYVEKVINNWQKRGEFEKVDDWRKRVNSETRQQKVYSLTKEAQNIYITNHTQKLKETDIDIVGNYDPDNETYRIKSSLSPNKELLVKVPFDYAQEFKATFASLEKKPLFFIENDRIGLAEYAFIMQDGRVFKYNNQASLTYSIAQVDYNFDAIEIDKSASNNNYQGGKQTISTKNMNFGTSDVDVNIPNALEKQENVYAVIIANENYENEKNVEYAYNDGQIFKEYCVKALGIPEKQVHFRSDATLNHITFEVNWIKQMAKACNGDAKFIFYYAGHGVPEDNMKDAYLLPVDGTGADLTSGYKLSNLYATLGDIPAENVLVLLDACFSGSQRSGEHIASTRGVSIKVKLDAPKGNMVVFSAATGSETAHPYREKYHGLFTYYMLKKIQEQKGQLTLGELSDFVTSNVSKTSLINNSKSQTPTLSPAHSMVDVWRELIIK